MEIQRIDELDKTNPWSSIWSATMIEIREIFHTTLQATSAQRRKAIVHTKFEADLPLVRNNRQNLIQINNKKENIKKLFHYY
jgi:hypothetical protein